MCKCGTIARTASGAILAFDSAGNAVGVVQGIYDATQNGVSISNGAQVAGGLLGLGANAAAVKGTKTPASPKEIALSHPASPGRQLPFGDSERATAANNTLDRVASGGQLPSKKEGTIFRNDRGQLPQGTYREYTVETPGASNRGTRRIIVDQNTGKTYYTDDHYRSFIQIDPRKK